MSLSFQLKADNHLNFLRLIAAVMVLFSHAFPLSYGVSAQEPLIVFSRGQETLGGLAVSIFFIISGFLITQSYERTQHWATYLQHRILRIFPALIASLVFCVVAGAFLTSQSLIAYLTSHETAHFFFYNLILVRQHYDTLPGVFISNPYPSIINGSLWTLQVEFAFYIVVALLGHMRQLNKTTATSLFLIALCSSVVIASPRLGILVRMFSFFSIGMMTYFYWEKIQWNLWFAMLAMGGFIISLRMGAYFFIAPVCLAYLIFYFAYCIRMDFLKGFQRRDYSYGVYVFAFPIQQYVSYVVGGTVQWWENVLMALPLTMLCALLSWHLIEKPALKMKRSGFLVGRVSVSS